jgi:glycosyltransferase involved in cell wall biosynthesis
MPDPPRITVVVPIHDEADYLPGALAALLDELAAVDADATVVLAENGSTDGTAELADQLAAEHSSVVARHRDVADYGAAMRDGFMSASGDWVVNFDIDYFSGDFLAQTLALEPRPDIVLASKRVEGADDRRNPMRRTATWGFNLMLRVLFGSAVSDTHGMKAVRIDVVEAIAPSVVATQDLFDTELVIRAERAGYRIVELAASVEELRATGMGLLQRVPRTLVGLLHLRWRLWRGR